MKLIARIYFYCTVKFLAPKEGGTILYSHYADIWAWYASDTKRWVFERGRFDVGGVVAPFTGV